MSEKTDWKLFRDKIKNPRDRWDRIENGVGVGMPDTNYCINGCEGWMEIKSPIEPARVQTPLFGSNHNLSQDQKNWFKRQMLAGGRAYIMISTDQRWILIHGKHADTVNDLTVQGLLSIAAWVSLKPVRDVSGWAKLREALQR